MKINGERYRQSVGDTIYSFRSGTAHSRVLTISGEALSCNTMTHLSTYDSGTRVSKGSRALRYITDVRVPAYGSAKGQ
jgi:hypothetical protein